MKINKTIIKIVSIFSFAIFLLLWPMTILSANSDIWFFLQRGKISLSDGDVKNYDQLMAYFLKGEVNNLDFLTQSEMSHLHDVRILLVKVNMFFWFSIILFLLTFLSLGKNMRNIVKKTSAAVLVFLVLLIIMSIANFNCTFIKFHDMFFTDNYAFASDSMIKILYPDSFVRKVFIVYFLLSIVGCLAVMAVSYMLKK